MIHISTNLEHKNKKTHTHTHTRIYIYIYIEREREREREKRVYPRIPKRMGNVSSVPLCKASSSAVNNL